MSDYTVITNFGAKDALNTGDSGKVVKGAEFTAEFEAIKTAVNSKADKASPTFTGTATIPTASVTTLSATTLSLGNWTIKLDTNELVFEYNGTDVFKLGTDGAVTSADNVTAYGTI